MLKSSPPWSVGLKADLGFGKSPSPQKRILTGTTRALYDCLSGSMTENSSPQCSDLAREECGDVPNRRRDFHSIRD
jgi:hypothetical protein